MIDDRPAPDANVRDDAGSVRPAVAIAADRYVRIPLFCALTGWSEAAVRRKREEGIWRDGHVFRKVRGCLLIDMEGYHRWVQGDGATA